MPNADDDASSTKPLLHKRQPKRKNYAKAAADLMSTYGFGGGVPDPLIMPESKSSRSTAQTGASSGDKSPTAKSALSQILSFSSHKSQVDQKPEGNGPKTAKPKPAESNTGEEDATSPKNEGRS